MENLLQALRTLTKAPYVGCGCCAGQEAGWDRGSRGYTIRVFTWQRERKPTTAQGYVCTRDCRTA